MQTNNLHALDPWCILSWLSIDMESRVNGMWLVTIWPATLLGEKANPVTNVLCAFFV